MVFLRSHRAALIALHILFYAGFALWRSVFLPLPLVQTCVLGILFIWISIVDVERKEIPDTASLLLALTGLVFAYEANLNLLDHVLAGILWSSLFLGIGIGYSRLRGWQGLGFGDVKLMVGIGLWLGLAGATLAVFAAAMAAIGTIVAAKLAGRETFAGIGTTAVAFGPFLCLSAWVIWLF